MIRPGARLEWVSKTEGGVQDDSQASQLGY